MNIGFHHFLYKYKSAEQNLLIKSPKFKELVDKAVYVLGFLGVLVILPQILKIWVDKDVNGVSITTWIGFFIGSSFWLFYGLVHKEKPIIFSNFLVILADLMVIIGLMFVK